MEYLIGLVLALAVAGLAVGVGFCRDRSFAPTVLIVVASYYVLFAVIGSVSRILIIETAIASGFLLLGVLGFKTNLWVVAAALVGHGVFDFVHSSLIQNTGVPAWWPGFCLGFDVLFGVWFAALLVRRSHPSLTSTSLAHEGRGVYLS
jgi:hypothetical protein